MTIAELTKALTGAGFKVELTGAHSDVLTRGRREVPYLEIGVQVGRWVWAWFKLYRADEDVARYVTFTHSYSMNTGRKKTGWAENFRVTRLLRRKTGLTDLMF